MLKLLIIGDSDWGKTSIVNVYISGAFDENQGPTIAGAFKNKEYAYGDEVIKLNVWDIAGQDRLGGISKLYWRDAAGAIVVADLTRKETLENAVLWKQQIEDYAVTDATIDKIPFILAWNKYDLVNEGSK